MVESDHFSLADSFESTIEFPANQEVSGPSSNLSYSVAGGVVNAFKSQPVLTY
jgi:hypothetical protein